MHPITLYTSFIHSIIHCGHTEETNRLRIMIQETLNIHNNIPNVILVDIFRRKLFSEKTILPFNNNENHEKIMINIFKEEKYDNLFKI